MEDARQEARVRSMARRNGYVVRRSRRSVDAHNYGDFMLVDADTNIVQLGGNFDATLDEIERWLTH